MSKRPLHQPQDRPPRPVRQLAARQPLESLSRHDLEDDPTRGSLLYQAIATQDTTELTGDGWLDRLEAIIRIKARVAAMEAEAVAGFDDALHGVSADLGHRYPEPGDRPATPGERRWIAGDLRSVADEIALILNMHRGSATTRIHTSCELVHNFHATLRALSEGHLTERAAFTIVSELSVLDDLNQIHAAEAAILDWARTHPLVDLKQACRRETARRSPTATDKAHQRAHNERSVRMYTDDNGRADLVHSQDAIDASAVMTSLSRAAARHRCLGDPRTLDQLRADIALNRLLPRTKQPTTPPADTDTAPPDTTPSADQAPPAAEPPTNHEPTNTSPQAADTPYDDPSSDPVSDHTEPPTEPEPPADPDYEAPSDSLEDSNDPFDPYDDLSRNSMPCDAEGKSPRDRSDSRTDHSPRDRGESRTDRESYRYGDHADTDSVRGRDTSPGPWDEAAPGGAEATVVIHATGAEVRALINVEAGTGGEADHHGPIPQSTLRKHLLKALAQTLLPNLPTTPTNSRPGAATYRARSTSDDKPSGQNPGAEQTVDDRSSCDQSPTACGSSRIELRITDAPPPSDPNSYTPSAALDRYVRWRDRTCQFPGCNRPAEFTDLDHRIAFAAGGPTTAANLWCLCRHHHRLKHEGGWRIHQNPDGTHTWTSPTGRHYRNNPTDP